MEKIQLTREQYDIIQDRLGVFDYKKSDLIKNHIICLERGYLAEENMFLEDITIDNLIEILYVQDSYEILETEEEKKERWKHIIDSIQDGTAYYYSKSLLENFIKDFNVSLD